MKIIAPWGTDTQPKGYRYANGANIYCVYISFHYTCSRMQSHVLAAQKIKQE